MLELFNTTGRDGAPVPESGFTHGGKFHADDLFSTALLRILNPEIQVSRGFEVPEDFEGIVYDIGRGRYDHHQEDKEIRENGVPYAAFGLLWREYGECILTEEEASDFDEEFIQPLDESDNTGSDNALAHVLSRFNPNWDSEDTFDQRFWEAEKIAEDMLVRYLEAVQGTRRAFQLVEEAKQQSDGVILCLPRFAPWKKAVIGTGYQFVIYPSNRGGYCVQGVPVSEEDRTLVCDFPREWWGADRDKLRVISGIGEAGFCHPNGFIAGAETKEGVISMAEKALACKKEKENSL